jgi:hypothetical protein
MQLDLVACGKYMWHVPTTAGAKIFNFLSHAARRRSLFLRLSRIQLFPTWPQVLAFELQSK